MLSILLISAGAFFHEASTSLGKAEIARKKETIFTYGFLSLFLSTIVFFLIAIFVRGEFIFSIQSLPTLSLRAVLEILQAYVSIKAISVADRSTYGFLRILTIPLLLVVDFSLGYVLTPNQAIGASVLTLSVLFLLLNHGLRTKGIWLVLFSALNAVVTISLFKYNITNFNSVEVEQGIIQVILLLYFVFMVRRTSGENPILLLRKPVFFFQSLSQALGVVLISFGYSFVPASVATSINRSASVFFSLVAGNRYFHEKKLMQKLLAFLLLLLGFVIIAGFPLF